MKVDKLRTVIIYIIIILLGLVCLLPLLNIVAISFSSSAAVEGNMVGLIPVGFSTAAYKKILEDSQFWHSFLISVERVVLALIINFVLIVLMAYPLSKTNAQFRGRNIYANLMIFAMLFNGGMIPTYLVVRYTGLLNTFWAMILPCAVGTYYIILMMNFMKGLPEAISESAFIDGAGHWTTLTRIILPLCKPSIATVSLFIILQHWNSWFDGMLYIKDMSLKPLQTYLRSIVIVDSAVGETGMTLEDAVANATADGANGAKIFLAIFPIMCVYPFLQKYFAKGLVRGSVKE